MLSPSLYVPAAALLASLLPAPVMAQLLTDCNPTLKDCPADPAFGTAHTFYFNSTPATGLFNTSAGTIDYSSENGAAFTIAKKGYSPTLETNFYFFWGKTEVIMKAANGTGIISSIVWGSDDLDEMDWEFKGGDPGNVQTNYFGKGVQNDTNGAGFPVDGGVQADWHNYTNVWTADKLEWWIDGKLVRSLLPADANNTESYPQTPMTLRLGIWAGGDDSQPTGTIEWAGGKTDYDAGPFTMHVQSAHVEDYSSGKEYYYSDRSGTGSSIKITQPDANSTAVDTINTPPVEEDKSLSEKWDGLSDGAKEGVYAGAASVGAIALIALLFYYFKQRRRGQREAALAAKNQETERLELERFKKEGRNPDALNFEGADYDASSMGKGGNVTTAAYSIPSPESRSNSLHSAEKASAWDPTGSGANSGMRSPMPLLRNGTNSPGPQGFNGPSRNNSYVSPMQTQSPGMPSSFPVSASPARQLSSPNPAVRMGSPGPQAGGYSAMDRTASPGPLQSQNSFNSSRSPGGHGTGGSYGAGDNYYDGNGYR
ncbi:concanavalin A-like lectin/glucanase domain-containing protein [Xylariales sp. AK1849]|nr:concanavalin A-like lectin/glucanase domain-containing protein [Xylariales sp. AK1849]